jgi:Bacterial aa3 type cytochrome c oxidase subunit IV
MAASDNDMRAHQETYSGVMGLLKWGTIGVAILAALIVLWIAR